LYKCCESGIQCIFDPWIQDPGWVKNQDPDPGCISRIIFLRAEKQFFGLLKFFDADPGSRIRNLFDPGSGSGINIPDPQHCFVPEMLVLAKVTDQSSESDLGQPLSLGVFVQPSFTSAKQQESEHPATAARLHYNISTSVFCTRIFKQSMEARNPVGIGLSYRPIRLHSTAELVSLILLWDP
jgi:hypothetical protein